MVGQMISTATLAIGMVFVARILGPSDFGTYSVVLVPASIALLLTDPGINTALTRYIAIFQHRGEELEKMDTLSTGLIFNLLIAVALSIILYLLSSPIAVFFLKNPDFEGLLRVASFVLIGQALMNTTNAIFIGSDKMHFASISNIIYSVLKGGVASLLAYLGLGPLGAVIGHVVGFLITGTLGVIIVLFFIAPGKALHKLSIRKIGELLRFGIPIYLSTLITGGLSQLYNSLMVIYVAIELIGNYNVALNFVTLIVFIASPIATAIYPLFSKLERNSRELEYAYQVTTKFSALVTIPVIMGLISLSDPLIATIYGSEYPYAAEYLSLFVLINLPIGIGSLCSQSLLNSQRETKIVFRINLIALFTGAPLAFFLISRYGIIGLISAMIVSNYLAALYGLIWIWRKFGIIMDLRSSAKIYLSALFALAATSLTLNTYNVFLLAKLVIGLIIYSVTYLVMIKLTKTLNKSDYPVFRAFVGEKGSLAGILNKLLDIFESD